MNKYLSNLIARSSEEAEIAKPRLPSFFEPQKPEHGAIQSFVLGPQKVEPSENTPVIVEKHMMRLSKSRAPQSPPSEEQPLGPGLKPTLADEKLSSAVAGRETTAKGWPRTPPLREEVRGKDADRFPVFADALTPTLPDNKGLIEKRKNAQSMGEEVGTERQVHVQGREPAIAARQLSAESRRVTSYPANEAADSRARHTLQATDNFQDRLGGPVPGPSLLAAPSPALVVPRKFEKQNSAFHTDSPQAEPTIHVTIGRVEVRANIEEKPRKSARTATTVMNLEDYLRKQRSGAGR
jgi:hypothetical protein